MATHLTLKDIQPYAAEHGGRCLSKEYIDSYTPLVWQCKEGHSWEADLIVIKQGSWCPQCLKNKIKLEELNAIAEKRGGKCLSEKYVNTHTKLKWQCANGHKWSAEPSSIKQGTWCGPCFKEESKNEELKKLKLIAQAKGGKCLSEKYTHQHATFKWQCANGHKWSAQAYSIKIGFWCAQCTKDEKNKKELKKLKLIAQAKGGKCLSEKYINNDIKLKWQCAKGHKWLALPKGIIINQWCWKCYWTKVQEEAFERVKFIAESKGGKCLSVSCKNKRSFLKWQCKEGHTWLAQRETITRGLWCVKCNRNEVCREELKNLQAIAQKKGGKCLSTQFVATDKKLIWQCREGHTFSSQPNTVKSGGWCYFCGRKQAAQKRRKFTLKQLQQYAERHGGRMLSTEYVNKDKPLKWQCEKGHVWQTVADMVSRGTWYCPVCHNNSRATYYKHIYTGAGEEEGIAYSNYQKRKPKK